MFVDAQTSMDILSAQSEQNVSELIAKYNTSSLEDKKAIEDVLCASINYNDFTYEEIVTLQEQCKDKSLLVFFNELKIQKEIEIIDYIKNLTTEQINIYVGHFPKRKDIVYGYLGYIVHNSRNDLSFLELNYINNTLPSIWTTQLSEERKGRTQEKKELMSKSVEEFCKEETSLISKLYYNLEKKTWQYLNQRYRDAAARYSQIGIVPDNVSAMEKQYRKIVNSYVNGDNLRKILQQEANSYCETINKARADYALIANQTDYAKLSISIPKIDLQYSASTKSLQKVSDARTAFQDSREFNSTAASLASWFISGFVAQGLRGLADMSAVEDLANAEIEARKSYMKDVYDALQPKVNTVISSIHKSIDNYIISNQNEFKNGIKK